MDTLRLSEEKVELLGERYGREVRLVYGCISGPRPRWRIGGRALGTGVPASLGVQWLASGSVKARVVLPPEPCIEPERFLHELGGRRRGIRTYEDDGVKRRRI